MLGLSNFYPLSSFQDNRIETTGGAGAVILKLGYSMVGRSGLINPGKPARLQNLEHQASDVYTGCPRSLEALLFHPCSQQLLRNEIGYGKEYAHANVQLYPIIDFCKTTSLSWCVSSHVPTKFQRYPSSRFQDTEIRGGTSAHAYVGTCRCITPMTCATPLLGL